MATKYDTTRHTLAQARRCPQWQRLIDSIHKAQAAKGYDGRQFGEAEMEHFDALLIGTPVEKTNWRTENPRDFAAYWVERQQSYWLNDVTTVRYVLKCVYGDDLANVNTIAEETLEDPTPVADEATALDFTRRANHQTGNNS